MVANDTNLSFISVNVLTALLDCGADLTLALSKSLDPLLSHVIDLRADLVALLLEDPRVQATVNVQESVGVSALHCACRLLDKPGAPTIVQQLLQACADLTLETQGGKTPLNMLQHYHPTHPTTLALVDQSLDAEKVSFLIKARRLVMASTRASPPSFLRDRVARGLPFPDVALAPVTDDQNDDELRTMLAWLVGLEGAGMPRDIFWVVLDLLMPFWDPSWRAMKRGGRGGQGQAEKVYRGRNSSINGTKTICRKTSTTSSKDTSSNTRSTSLQRDIEGNRRREERVHVRASDVKMK